MKKTLFGLLLYSSLAFAQKTTKAPSQKVIDNYHGIEVVDEYRNFENLNDTAVLNWIKTQSTFSKKVLNEIKNKNSYLNLVDKIVDSRYNEIRKKPVNVSKQQNLIFKFDTKDSIYKIYYRKNDKEDFKMIFSPKDYKPETKINYYVNYHKLSPNKTYVAISLTQNGQEISDVIIYDLKKGKLLKDIIRNTWVSDIGGINWLKNESGFIYTYLPDTDKNSVGFIKNSEAVFYKLGSKEGEHKVLFSKKNNPNININSNDFCVAFQSGEYFYAKLSGVESLNDYYYAIKDENLNFNWIPFFEKKDKVFDFKNKNNSYIFYKDLNGYSCLFETEIKNPNFKKTNPIVQFPKNEIINNFIISKNDIYISTITNGIVAKLYVYKKALKEIKLPIPSGSVSIYPIEGNKTEFWVSCGSWNKPSIRYKYNFKKRIFIEDNYKEPVKISEFDDIVFEELTIKTHDGLDLPLTLIYKKGMVKDGNNRVIMDGYGAYGYNYSPYFSPYSLLWVYQGGILVNTHVRGGGEKGEEWRLGGSKATKSNSWKDFISSAEFLIANGYTNPEKLGVKGGSAGGILIGRAITERPDLFKAAIIDVGILNVLRFELSPNGENNLKEFGSFKIKEEFESLYKMDPFHHIKRGVSYPTTLITSGMNDNRVIYWQPAKFAAKLMEFNSGENPIFYFNDNESGHGENSLKKDYEKLEMTYNFFNWQLGNPEYN
ncbi:prolyl oligopeptidase family serine peptidase [Flavobacterium urocaniciphilum]|uniref:Prolyl oligopeptidase n=1 Tax=Flavobacterium urocaniciphilum TaxID=1299341 RepID=A0A1H9DKA9_9FLAO|nr:prolyl oligopeptidase family serine peptidase [Flavobacterium urocaniciphilum]SEQ13869.1 prolyl oligopeptidase [Flavobacterium urocaniciphilum]